MWAAAGVWSDAQSSRTDAVTPGKSERPLVLLGSVQAGAAYGAAFLPEDTQGSCLRWKVQLCVTVSPRVYDVCDAVAQAGGCSSQRTPTPDSAVAPRGFSHAVLRAREEAALLTRVNGSSSAG